VSGANGTTVVLVHAAWADGSSWNKVSGELTRQGCGVVSAQIPLTSFDADVAALKRVIRMQRGPMVVAGHSYGGAVVTAAAAGERNVRSLVYVAAMAPDEGETVGYLFFRAPQHPQAPRIQPDADGFVWIDAETIRSGVAQDATPDEATLMAINQKPVSVRCMDAPMSTPAWREKPSWYLVAEHDRVLSPDTQRYMAERMHATVISLPVDHVPLLSRPDAVVGLIRQATSAV